VRTAPRHLLILSLVAGSALAPAAALAAPTIAEYGVGVSGATPKSMALASDGNVWFADDANHANIGRVTPAGTITEFNNGLSHDAHLGDLTAGAGGLWVTETDKNNVARVTTGGSTSGTITEFSGGNHDKPVGIAAGPDGNLWIAAQGKGGAIIRMTTSGATTDFTTGLTTNSNPTDIVRGPDDNLWFTEAVGARIGRITPQGVITEIALGVGVGTPQDIAPGPDGNLWFTVNGTAPAIGRITPTGVVTLFTAGLPVNSSPQDLVAGADGALYFTDSGANATGRITPQGTITTFATGLSASAGLRGIAAGADGAVWFAEQARAAIGRLTVAPTAAATSASGVTSTGARLTSAVTPNSQTTTAYIEWGTTTAYGTQTTSPTVGSDAVAHTVTATIPGLTPSTTYHARVVATNASGTTNGPDLMFTTTAANAPSATTEGATAVGDGDATLNAMVNPESFATTYDFEWGTTAAYGQTLTPSDTSVGSDGNDHAVAAPLTGLEPNTTYHYRVVATGNGTTAGADRTFRTDAVAPAATTGSATGLTREGATLTGTVDPRNSGTAYRFEWGTPPRFDQSAPLPDGLVGDDHAAHAVSAPLTGLDPNTTYHARLVATSNAGTTYGGEQTFTTLPEAPEVVDLALDAPTTTSVTVRGHINPHKSPTSTWFEYGTTDAYGRRSDDASMPGNADMNSHSVLDVALTDLVPGTLYHVRLVAMNAGGTTRGAETTFTSAAAPADPASGTTPDAPTLPAAAAKPEFARTVVASASGVVRFRAPGGQTATVDPSAPIPAGSTIDATQGTVTVTSALDREGHTQSATFRGAAFRLTQAASGKGMVVITTRSRPTGCPGATSAAAPRAFVAARRRPRPKSLWASDDHGRYTTAGHGSTAVVRGTQWTTTETCAGTRTTVTKGAVAVYDKRLRQTRTLRAGQSHLARLKR
jgi:streptogramin lyase